MSNRQCVQTASRQHTVTACAVTVETQCVSSMNPMTMLVCRAKPERSPASTDIFLCVHQTRILPWKICRACHVLKIMWFQATVKTWCGCASGCPSEWKGTCPTCQTSRIRHRSKMVHVSLADSEAMLIVEHLLGISREKFCMLYRIYIDNQTHNSDEDDVDGTR